MRIGFSFLVLIILLGCSPKMKSIWIYNEDSCEVRQEVEGYERPCADPLNYAPDHVEKPVGVKVNFHIIDCPEQNCNFNLEDGKKYLKNLLRNANERLGKNEKMTLPLGNDTRVLDPGYRYKITGLEEGDDGFYYHVDSVHYYYMNKGKYRNNYSRKVIEKYAVGDDTILNIFVISQPLDRLNSETYNPRRTGIALGTSLKVSGLFSDPTRPWMAGTLLNHEVGHILGLSHAWNKYDGCDDTPVHPNCWDANDPKCEGNYSNNVMDYNNKQMAFTPCQLGKIHKNFAREGAKTRGLIYHTWCNYDTSKVIVIDEEKHWLGNRDINHDIVISNTGKLHLHCRLSMAANSKILIEEGGELHLHSYSKIHNACGDKWAGIEIQTTQKEPQPAVFKYGNPYIKDVDGTEVIRSTNDEKGNPNLE